jgi:hypothetical protein
MSDGYIGRGPVGSIEDILRNVLLTTPLKYRGLWTPDTAYNQYDIVLIPPSSLYVCMTQHRSDIEFLPDIDKFDLFSSRFQVGEEYDPGLTYLIGETVLFQNSLYSCTQLSLGNLPTNGTYWDLVVSDLGRQYSNQITITGGTAFFDSLGAGEITSDLIPDQDGVYDLGSTANKWNDLYLNGTTIYLGDAEISSDATTVTITTGAGNQFVLSATGISGNTEVQINNNEIVTTTANTNLRLNPAGTGTIELEADTNITGNLDVTGNINLSGNLTIGDQPLDTVTVSADFTSSLIPNASATYDLGSSTQSWQKLYIDSIGSNTSAVTIDSNLETTLTTIDIVNTNATTVNFAGAATTIEIGAATGTTTINNDTELLGTLNVTGETTLSSVIVSDLTSGRVLLAGAAGNIEDSADLTFNGTKLSLVADQDITGTLRIIGTTALTLPAGTDLDKASFTAETGQIRFNSTIGQFEGYQGTVWSSLGGVRSVDGLTYITPELTPGASDDTLRFYTNGVLSASLSSTALTVVSTVSNTYINATTASTDSTTGALIVAGGAGIAGNLNIGANLNVDVDLTATGDVAINGGDLTTTSATFNLINSTATTVNFAGAATTLSIGADTGTTTVNNNLIIDGSVDVGGHILPDTDITYDLGSVSKRFKDLYLSGNTIYIGSQIISADDQNSKLSINNSLDIGSDLAVAGILDVTLDTTIGGSLTVTGDFTVNGTTTTVNSTTVSVDDINIILGATATPTDATADGGGITLRGDTDKTFNWASATGAWTSSESINITSGKSFKIATVDALTSTTVLGSATTASVAPNATTLTVGATTGTVTIRNSTVSVTNDLTVGGATTLNGSATVAETLEVTGDFSVNADKFTVDAVTGDTVIAGTLDVTAAAIFDSTLSVQNNFAVNTDKFTVDSLTGNTVINGTLDVAGAITLAAIDATTATFSGQVTSTVANGTAPLVVASTTLVSNLNADLLDGYNSNEDNVASTIVVRTSTNRIKATSVELSGTTGTTVLLTETSASGTLTLPATSDTLVAKNTTDTFTNKTINLTDNTLSGTIAEFNAALTNNDFATLAGTETFTSKTINLASNTLIGTVAEFNASLSDDDFVTLIGDETLSNKTLTNPVINAGSGTLVVPQSTSPVQVAAGSIVWDTVGNLLTVGSGAGRKTLVDTDSTQILTNKTLTSPVITGVSPTITLDGDLSGSITLTDLGSGTLTATIVANSVELGTDTTGNYVATVAGTTNQITVSGSGSETSAVTLSLPQDIHTGATPTFAGATLDAITVGVAQSTEITTTAGSLILSAADGTVNVDDNLTVTGNLTVNGTTTTVNSTVSTIVDPIIELGGTVDGGPSVADDNKDRGVKFNWYDGSAKVGFFGYDDSTGYFTFVPDATITGEVVSGAAGDIAAATFRGNVISDTITVSDGLLAIGDVTLTPNSGKVLNIAPADVGTVDNVNIGSVTSGSGAFTTLSASGATTITNTTDSTDKDTGALVVEGGVGIEKNLSVGGDLDISGTLAVNGTILFGGALTVDNGGTGRGSFTTNGVVYGNGTDQLKNTVASNPGGTNVATSFGILTTDVDSEPVWTDVIDGGAF